MENIIGTNLRRIRKEKGLSREDVAHEIGKDATIVTRYETGTVDIPSSVLLKLSRVLGVSLNAFAKGAR